MATKQTLQYIFREPTLPYLLTFITVVNITQLLLKTTPSDEEHSATYCPLFFDTRWKLIGYF